MYRIGLVMSMIDWGFCFQRSAQYLHKDLPIRFAHRIDDFRNLPFVVACNPLLLELVGKHISSRSYHRYTSSFQHERFIKIFHTLHSFPPVSNRIFSCACSMID